MSRALGTVLSAILAGAIPVLSAPAEVSKRPTKPDPSAIHAAVVANRLQPDRAVGVHDRRIVLGEALFEIEDGVLVPTAPVAGRVLEYLFLGQARILLEPPDPIEAGQLELFTGRRSLDADVEAAVLAIADEALLEALLERSRPVVLEPSVVDRAVATHRELLRKSDFGASGAEEGMTLALLGDAAYADWFGLWGRSYEVGDFVYRLHPEEIEPLALMSFNPVDTRGWDRLRLARHLRASQRDGRWLGLTVDDLGTWDIWSSSRFDAASERSLPRVAGFEAEHYELDVTVARGSRRLDGTARIRIRTESAGRRAVSMGLFRDLVVERVVDEDGRTLPHFRSGNRVLAVLPEPSRVGESSVVTVEYGGRVLAWVARGSYDLEETTAWHPHVGTVDRATYDVRIRYPQRDTLVGSGRTVERRRDGRYRVERRVIDRPAIAFSFVLGDFHVLEERIDDVRLRVAISKRLPRRINAERRAALVTAVRESLEHFEELFGPYPLDYLNVATVPRDYSQSFAGFIAMSQEVLVPPVFDGRTLPRDETVAHEVAHQWWGNQVGWWSYRDQWLSEAMANYSAMMFDVAHEGGDADSLARISAGWRESLSVTTLDGIRIDSLGPVVLGTRLNSSRASDGYRAIVYRKGAVVLAMLARAVGPEAFAEMLRSFTEAADGKVITTEMFLEALERMSGLELDGFADQFIYGTGITDIFYEYDVETAADGRTRIVGVAREAVQPEFAARVVRSGRGWDVVRERLPPLDAGAPSLMVPYRITVRATPEDGTARTAGGKWVRSYVGRQLILQRGRTEFAVDAPGDPVAFRLDPRGEIFARFYPEDRHPKRVARFRARNLLAEGRTEQARDAYRAALAIPLDATAAPGERLFRSREHRARHADAHIRLQLARLALDLGDVAEAEAEVDAVDALLGDGSTALEVARATLRARVDLMRGDYETAHARLKRTLRYLDPRRRQGRWQQMMWKLGASGERLEVTEAYALLAVAAFEIGEDDDLRWAFAEAMDRGADVDALGLSVGSCHPSRSDESDHPEPRSRACPSRANRASPG